MADEQALVAGIAEHLLARGEWLATAESCTGGLIAKLLTDRAGSSGWFERGLTTYSNAAKHELLAVPEAVLQRDGAVSEAVVRAMARGLGTQAPVQWGIAVTGIAGPGGGSADKPVDTVWLGWLIAGKRVDVELCRFSGDREQVRQQTAHRALAGLLERLRGS